MLNAISDYAKTADFGIEEMQFEIENKEIVGFIQGVSKNMCHISCGDSSRKNKIYFSYQLRSDSALFPSYRVLKGGNVPATSKHRFPLEHPS